MLLNGQNPNKTTTVHMSSTSVETEAACQAALDIVAMRHMLEEIGIWYNEPVVIYEDNQPTIRVANNDWLPSSGIRCRVSLLVWVY